MTAAHVHGEGPVSPPEAPGITEEGRRRAEKIRRLVGFMIADIRWMQDHATELAHRIHSDAHGGFPAGGRLNARGDNRNDNGSKVGPVEGLVGKINDHATVNGEAVMKGLVELRQFTGELKSLCKAVLPMTPKAAQEATELQRGTLPPGECSNCGKQVFAPAEYLRKGECPACAKYRSRTGRARPCDEPKPQAAPPAAPKGRVTGFVYYIRRPQDGYIKIGYSVNPEKRLASFKTTLGDVELLVTERGSYELERERHKYWQFFRAHGEWFKPDQSLLDHIARLQREEAWLASVRVE